VVVVVVLLLGQLRCTSSHSCYEPPTSMSATATVVLLATVVTPPTHLRTAPRARGHLLSVHASMPPRSVHWALSRAGAACSLPHAAGWTHKRA
jgi:hypothetical protein